MSKGGLMNIKHEVDEVPEEGEVETKADIEMDQFPDDAGFVQLPVENN